MTPRIVKKKAKNTFGNIKKGKEYSVKIRDGFAGKHGCCNGMYLSTKQMKDTFGINAH